MVDRDNPLQSDPVTAPSAAPSIDGRHLSPVLDSTLMGGARDRAVQEGRHRRERKRGHVPCNLDFGFYNYIITQLTVHHASCYNSAHTETDRRDHGRDAVLMAVLYRL